MDGSKLYGAASNIAVLLRNQTLPSHPDLLESFWIPDSSPTFYGVEGDNTKDRRLFQAVHEEENGEEDLHRAEKKRRLTAGQVQLLERNFEAENKLEPERKNQLAKELGLQPRQVAIWFQNRRARFKTKQLEKDYDSLKASYDTLMAHYDLLLKDKEKLTTEVMLLTEKMLTREKERERTEAGEGMMIVTPSQKAIPNAQAILFCKHEDASSAKSDIFDPDSPRGNHSSLLEAEQSEFSQDEEDHLSKTLMMPSTLFFPKLEDCSYSYPDPDPPANASCNLGGLPAPEEHPIWFWSY